MGRKRLADGGLDVLAYEREARVAGFLRIAGLDEAGRGPLAGPVVAAAVILPADMLLPGVTDSKLLTERRREQLFDDIMRIAVATGIGVVDERTIESVNILEASLLAMEQALRNLSHSPDYLLIDGNCTLIRVSLPQRAIVKGDHHSHSIAAASILAKVSRDRVMLELHERYPQYNFRKHKGYGTAEHLALLRQYGPCEAHRRTFEPVAGMVRGPE